MTKSRPVVVGHVPGQTAPIDAAIDEVERRSCPMVVVHVTRTALGGTEGQVVPMKARLERSRIDAEELQKQLDDRIRDATVEVRTTSQDDVAQVLLDTITDTSAELLVIGIRQRSAVGKFVLGSVAQELLLRANCAVLAVPLGRKHK
jgi:nucleotide-binding universal stress UspA family protein